jgi:hypothetical protein
MFTDEPFSLVVVRVSRDSTRKLTLDGAAGGMNLTGVFDVGDADTFAGGFSACCPSMQASARTASSTCSKQATTRPERVWDAALVDGVKIL